MQSTRPTSNHAVNLFDRATARWENRADRMEKNATRALSDAGEDVGDAFEHAGHAGGHLIGSGVNAVTSVQRALEGGAHTLAAGGHMVAAAGLGVVGTGAAAVEWVASGGRWVAKNVAKGFLAMANACSRMLGKRGTVTLRQLQADPNATRVSDRLFVAAGKQADRVPVSGRAAWEAYVASVGHAVGSGLNLAMVAGHTVAVAGELVSAAGHVGASGAYHLAQLGATVAASAAQYAEAGVEGARELTLLGARISAAAANLLAQPDQGVVEVRAQRQIKAFHMELRRLTPVVSNVRPVAVGAL